MVSTIAQMTKEEFKEMLEPMLETLIEHKFLEILGDPDEGLEVRATVRQRLLRQKQLVASGSRGQLFEEVVRQLESREIIS